MTGPQVSMLAISLSHPVFEINLADPVAMNINLSWEQLHWQLLDYNSC